MFQHFIELLQFPFMQRALVLGLALSLVSGLLGVNLQLKRYAMIGYSLSQVSFCALALALALELSPLPFSIPMVCLAAFGLLSLRKAAQWSDGLMAIVATSALALGVSIIAASRGMTTDVCNFMFGSILAIPPEDFVPSLVLLALILAIYLLYYRRFFAFTYDEDYARASGHPVAVYTMLQALLLSLLIVLGMRMMGSLLITALLVFPVLSGQGLCRSFRGLSVFAAIYSLLAFACGLFVSSLLNLPAGAAVALVQLFFFGLCLLLGRLLHRG